MAVAGHVGARLVVGMHVGWVGEPCWRDAMQAKARVMHGACKDDHGCLCGCKDVHARLLAWCWVGVCMPEGPLVACRKHDHVEASSLGR